MKRRVFAIMLVSTMALAISACGKTQNQSESNITSDQKAEESIAEEVKEEPETVVEENPNIIDGVDYTPYYDGQVALEDIFERQVTYDSLRIFVFDTGKIYGVMSDGETIEFEDRKEAYVFTYYSPKPVTKVESIGEVGYFQDFHEQYKKLPAQGYYHPGEKGNKVGIKVTYEDGTEDSIVVNFEAIDSPESDSSDTVEETADDEMYDTDGIDFTEFDNGGDIFSVIDNQMKYDTLKVIAMNSDCKAKAVLSDGGSYKLKGEDGQYCLLYFYTPKEVSSVEKIGEFNTFDDMRSVDPKLVGIATYMKSGEKLPVGIKVTYSDGTEDSITIYVTQ